MRDSKILVVGGAGYIGSHTAKLLHKRGYIPVVLDNLSTGHRQSVKYGPFYHGHYEDIDLVTKILKSEKIDTIMHFGAKALVGESVENPLLYYSANTSGTVQLLTAMRKAGVHRFIFSSTCATFGITNNIPIHEGVAQSPVNPYGQSKLFVEKILKDLDGLENGIRSVVLRYFNAAGADPEGELGEDHEPETHLIPRIFQSLLGKTKKLIVNGNDYPTPDGTCIRDYVHVNDLADAHIQAMELMIEKDQSFDFNLGSENGYSVLEVIKMVEKVTNKKVDYEIGPRRPGDPASLVAKSTKAKTDLSWNPKFDLEAIVQTTYHWMTKHPQGFEDAQDGATKLGRL